MHVVSASRRTDIPAFHAQWLMNRIREGFARVCSPFGGGIFDVSLALEDVIAIVFWTKNAAPLMPYLTELSEHGHCFTFLYTINNYPLFLEPRVPELGHTLKVVEDLCGRFTNSVFRWRYDTIVVTDTVNRRWHVRNFEMLSRMLAPYTKECIFSFCDYYKKTVRRMEREVPDYHMPDQSESRQIAEDLAEIAGNWGISLISCAHDFLVSRTIGKAGCIDPEFLVEVVDTPERREALGMLKRAPTRKECGCAVSRDIGAYDTCGHGCVYCYANSDPGLALKNLSRVGKDSPCLVPAMTEPANPS
jgi:hypothetical protein